MLHIGFADAGRGTLPRLLCPLQNARSPKYSASTLWYRTGATPGAQWGMLFASGVPPAAKGAASATPPVYRAEYQGLLTFFRSHSRRGKVPLPAGFRRHYIRLPECLCMNFCMMFRCNICKAFCMVFRYNVCKAFENHRLPSSVRIAKI